MDPKIYWMIDGVRVTVIPCRSTPSASLFRRRYGGRDGIWYLDDRMDPRAYDWFDLMFPESYPLLDKTHLHQELMSRFPQSLPTRIMLQLAKSR